MTKYNNMNKFRNKRMNKYDIFKKNIFNQRRNCLNQFIFI